MRIVRFHLEPWQRGGSEISSPSSASSSIPFLSPSVQRRQRTPSSEDLSSIDTALFEKKSIRVDTEHRRTGRKCSKMVKRLSVLCSDVIAANVRAIIVSSFNQLTTHNLHLTNGSICVSLFSHKHSHWARVKVICDRAKIWAPAASMT